MSIAQFAWSNLCCYCYCCGCYFDQIAMFYRWFIRGRNLHSSSETWTDYDFRIVPRPPKATVSRRKIATSKQQQHHHQMVSYNEITHKLLNLRNYLDTFMTRFLAMSRLFKSKLISITFSPSRWSYHVVKLLQHVAYHLHTMPPLLFSPEHAFWWTYSSNSSNSNSKLSPPTWPLINVCFDRLATLQRI